MAALGAHQAAVAQATRYRDGFTQSSPPRLHVGASVVDARQLGGGGHNERVGCGEQAAQWSAAMASTGAESTVAREEVARWRILFFR